MLDKSRPELHYQTAAPPVTRGQFRILLFLMLILVVMTAQSNYAPGITAWVKNAWALHQQDVAHRAEVKRNLAIQQQCLSYSEPASKAVWEEDPERAAKLLAGAGYQAIVPSGGPGSVLHEVVPPLAVALMPKFVPESIFSGLQFSPAANAALLFLHGRQASAQPQRLVAVCIYCSLQATEVGGLANQSFDGNLTKWQYLVANSFGTQNDDGIPTPDGPPYLSLQMQPNAGGTGMPVHWTAATQPGDPGKLKVQYKQQLRVYAGQPDPADASHFTINYVLDGQPGVIDGWLKADGSVALRPRAGKVVNSLWYPYAK